MCVLAGTGLTETRHAAGAAAAPASPQSASLVIQVRGRALLARLLGVVEHCFCATNQPSQEVVVWACGWDGWFQPIPHQHPCKSLEWGSGRTPRAPTQARVLQGQPPISIPCDPRERQGNP